MTTSSLIATHDFCTYHQVELTFINSLQDAGLVEIRIIDETPFIHENQLQSLEKMIRLHNELDINVAGIEAITHLLQRVELFQEELRTLKNRLRMYETD